MFNPQALTKKVQLLLNVISLPTGISFPKNKILQITGNLISNAIKFTPGEGKVKVSLALEVLENEKFLHLKVKDSRFGISPSKISEILEGDATTILGTSGEKGFGFGLNLVNHLVKFLKVSSF